MGLHSIGYLFREGLKSLWKNRTMSLASIAVLISCLLMTGVAGALSVNLSATMETVESNNVINVYLDANLPALTAVKVGEQLRQMENIADCTFVPKDDGLANMMQSLGDNEDSTLFDGFRGDENPLPDSYKISLSDLSRYRETMERIEAVEGVWKVTDYSNVATKLSNLDRLVRYASVGIVAILGVVSLFIISNTVKATLYSRRVEITIMKSVGATNGFVRIPFIVEGMVIGALSGAISATILYFAYDKGAEIIYSIVTFLTIVDIHPFTGFMYLAYILIGMLLGMLGSVISIGRYLKREGEDAIV